MEEERLTRIPANSNARRINYRQAHLVATIVCCGACFTKPALPIPLAFSTDLGGGLDATPLAAYLRCLVSAVMLASVLLPLSLSSCRTGVSGADAAQLIFINADVVTMNQGQPSAQAVSVKAGKILAVGSTEDLTRKYQGQATQVVDLHGKALLPGFIDPHSHFMNTLQISTWANVTAPPVGQVKSIPDIIAVLKEHQAKQKIAKGEWIIGYGYDSNELAEKRELTRDDLDPAFPDNPVMLIHISNHGAVLNSAAFKKMNISAATPTPQGELFFGSPVQRSPRDS
jgi:Amidohydrolase family